MTFDKDKQQIPIALRIFLGIWAVYYIYMMLNSIVIPKGSLITLLFNGGIFIYCVLYFIKQNYLLGKFGFIHLYLVFLFILILLMSSNFMASLKLWMKYSIGILCLPIGFDLFSNKSAVGKLWGILQLFLWLFIINYLISNILHLGGSQYNSGATGVEMGNLFDDALHTNLCILTMIPFMLYINKKNNVISLVLLCAFSVVLTIVLMKRTPILCLCLTTLCFITLWQYLKNKYGKLENIGTLIPTKIVVIGIISIGSLAYFYQGTIRLQYEARLDRFENGIEREGRTRELQYIANDILFNESVRTFLIGKETFNTVGTYANGRFGNRMIHENYGILLNGTGVLGIIFYISINIYFLILLFKYSKRVDFKNNPIAYFLFIAYISYWLMYTVASFSGTIWLVLYPSIHYMISGMILRYFHDYGKLDFTEESHDDKSGEYV